MHLNHRRNDTPARLARTLSEDGRDSLRTEKRHHWRRHRARWRQAIHHERWGDGPANRRCILYDLA